MRRISHIILSESEWNIGVAIGQRRQAENIRDHRKDRNNFRGDGVKTHIFGVHCEMAGAAAVGVLWRDTLFREADLGLRRQVRGAHYHHGRLLIHHDDNPTDIFILVTKEDDSPVFQVKGWAYGYEAKKDEFWRDPVGNRPCFFAPQRILRCMTTLNPEGFRPGAIPSAPARFRPSPLGECPRHSG